MKCRFFSLCLTLVLLVGCAATETAIPPTPNTAPTAVVSSTPAPSATNSVEPTAGSVLPEPSVGAIAPVPVDMPLPPGWQMVAWEDVLIPLPPQSEWSLDSAAVQINGAPVIASAGIKYALGTGEVEHTQGPFFTILQFNGSLDAWLDAEQKNDLSRAGNPVHDQTIRSITIGGHEAKAYQRAITGIGLTEYYAVKLDEKRLLWITSEDAENETYQQVIDALMITPP